MVAAAATIKDGVGAMVTATVRVEQWLRLYYRNCIVLYYLSINYKYTIWWDLDEKLGKRQSLSSCLGRCMK